MTKNLIYFTIGGNPLYARLLKLCITSLVSKTSKEAFNIDIMVMCSQDYKQYIDHIKGIDDVWIVPNSRNGVEASMKKVMIYKYPKINEYKSVIYLDSDIVAVGDVCKLFDVMNDDDDIVDKDVLYVFEEHQDAKFHNERFWSLGGYTDEKIKEFEKMKQGVFNCGHWGFHVSPVMLAHFKAVFKMIQDYNKKDYFYEQSFMNVYFNTRYLTKPVFNKHIFIPYLSDKFPRSKDNTVLVHVANAMLTPQNKYKEMLASLRQT
jgi:lipopolysaccharide biosynthesis glycosyltransferase